MKAGVCLREIGRMMGYSESTISRELAGRADYGHLYLNPAKPEPQGGYVTDSSGQRDFETRE